MKVLGVQRRGDNAVVRLEGNLIDVSTADGRTERVPGEPIEAWTPHTFEEVQAWNGQTPPNYELKDGKRGKVLVEKRSGPAPAYRNTREAFEAEARSRREWQALEEDRKDRRTALMTATEYVRDAAANLPMPIHEVPLVLNAAKRFYEWLRTSGEGEGSEAGLPTSSGRVDQPVQASPGSSADAHPAADSGTGGDAAGTAPPARPFSVDPAKCDHKRSNGKWVPWQIRSSADHTFVCPKCGTPKLLAMEATTADLGPA